MIAGKAQPHHYATRGLDGPWCTVLACKACCWTLSKGCAGHKATPAGDEARLDLFWMTRTNVHGQKSRVTGGHLEVAFEGGEAQLENAKLLVGVHAHGLGVALPHLLDEGCIILEQRLLPVKLLLHAGGKLPAGCRIATRACACTRPSAFMPLGLSEDPRTCQSSTVECLMQTVHLRGVQLCCSRETASRQPTLGHSCSGPCRDSSLEAVSRDKLSPEGSLVCWALLPRDQPA